MNLALSAIRRADSDDRSDIVDALFATRNRRSVLGTYSIDRYGDTTMKDYGLFKIKHGVATFVRTIDTDD